MVFTLHIAVRRRGDVPVQLSREHRRPLPRLPGVRPGRGAFRRRAGLPAGPGGGGGPGGGRSRRALVRPGAAAGSARTIQGGMVWVLAAGLVASLLWAVGYRFYLVKRYAAPRIGADELYEGMRGENALIVLDLRRDADYDLEDRMIAGSFRLRPATFHRFAHHLPRDRDLVFYCT